MQDWIKKRIIAKKCIEPVIQENSQTKRSGIYLYTRTDEFGVTWFYVGQGVDCYERQISHWLGYEQRLDLSIKRRKWWSSENPHGWTFEIIEFIPEEKLNDREQYWILHYIKKGWQTYNLNYGGNEGKKQTFGSSMKKGYRKGVEYGYAKARKEIAGLFEKNLQVIMRGEPNKLKEKAFDKFMTFLRGENEQKD